MTGPTRRRGAALETAILDAAGALLLDGGYAALTYEGVAAASGTGKASVYRRWPTKLELVMAVAYHHFDSVQALPDTGSLRGDLVAWLTLTARRFAGPAGIAMRGLVSELLADAPGHSWDELQLVRRHLSSEATRGLVERAAARGEPFHVPAPTALEAPTTILLWHGLTHGGAVSTDAIEAIVDDVALPLFRHG